MEAFLGMLTVGGATLLEKLGLGELRMGDVGVKALAAALSEGRLGSRLKELQLGLYYKDFPVSCTDKGILALLTAIMEGAQHVAHLEELSVWAPSMSVECATAFVEGVASSCQIQNFLMLITKRSRLRRHEPQEKG